MMFEEGLLFSRRVRHLAVAVLVAALRQRERPTHAVVAPAAVAAGRFRARLARAFCGRTVEAQWKARWKSPVTGSERSMAGGEISPLLQLPEVRQASLCSPILQPQSKLAGL